MGEDSIEQLKLAAESAEDAFEERKPRLLWIELGSTKVISKKSTSNRSYHHLLDSWEIEVRIMLELSTTAAEAEEELVRAIFKKRKLKRYLGEIARFKAIRDTKLQDDLERIQTLRQFRQKD